MWSLPTTSSLCFCTAKLSDTKRAVFLIMILLSHQFSKLQIYSVEVSNAILSLQELKELFNDNAYFFIIKGLLSSLLRDSLEPKRLNKIPQSKRDNLYTKLCNRKYRSVFSIKSLRPLYLLTWSMD